jgi:L-rhamnose mutarotase
MFPKLTFTNAAKDEGGYFFNEIIYKNGDTLESNEYNEHDWHMNFEPEYAKLYKRLFESDYTESIKSILEENSIEEYSLEKKLVDYIKDEDTPLFINFNWEDEQAHKNYVERLKNISKEQRCLPEAK